MNIMHLNAVVQFLKFYGNNKVQNFQSYAFDSDSDFFDESGETFEKIYHKRFSMKRPHEVKRRLDKYKDQKELDHMINDELFY